MPASVQEFSRPEGRLTWHGSHHIQTMMAEDDPVHVAVLNRDLEAVRRHLSSGLDPNVRNVNGLAPIHVAVIQNDPDVVHELLSWGTTEKNSQTISGKTALHLALECGHLAVASSLLTSGVNTRVKDGAGLSALERFISLTKPLPVGFDEFFLRHADVIMSEVRKAVCVLAYWDCADVLDRVLINDQKLASFSDEHQQTALHYCFSSESRVSVSSARVLIKHGADVNRRNVDGATPIHFLRGHRLANEPLARQFVRHVVSVHAQSSDGVMSPLHVASASGDVDLIQYIADCGTDINVKDGDSFTALHLAALHDQPEVVCMLLARGADVDPENERRQTPLHYASVLTRTTCCLTLIEGGATINHRDHFGMTSLHKAAGWGCPDVVRLLIRNGAGVNDPTDNLDMLPIHYSALNGLAEITEALILKSSELEHADREGQTPLHMAAKTGSVDVIKLLLLHGADPNVQDLKGLSPLHVACWHGHKQTVRTLINRGASRNVMTSQGQSPGNVALERGHFAILNALNDHRHSLSLYAPEQLESFERVRNATVPARLESLGQEDSCHETVAEEDNQILKPNGETRIDGDLNANVQANELPDHKVAYRSKRDRATTCTRCCVIS